VLVGHHARSDPGWSTGTTVVLVPDGAVGGADCRGGAPGTRELMLLRPSNLVREVHGVCLSGGSAYGLAAADGVMRWLGERSYGLPVGTEGHEVVPIVPACVLYDLPHSTWGNRPGAEFGYAACEAARDGAVPEGGRGAGTGATAGSLSGGVGTASAVLDDGTVVGALAVVNSYGEAVDPATGSPYALDLLVPGEVALTVPGVPARTLGTAARERGHNTTLGVVATDAGLGKADCERMAAAAQDGLARAVRPAHSLFDGDTVIALATGARPVPGTSGGAFAGTERAAGVDAVCFAAADAFARAVVRGVLAAESLPGVPCYRDAWPGSVP
jgi:L-aminopeptidase/D-esterase-like protein